MNLRIVFVVLFFELTTIHSNPLILPMENNWKFPNKLLPGTINFRIKGNVAPDFVQTLYRDLLTPPDHPILLQEAIIVNETPEENQIPKNCLCQSILIAYKTSQELLDELLLLTDQLLDTPTWDSRTLIVVTLEESSSLQTDQQHQLFNKLHDNGVFNIVLYTPSLNGTPSQMYAKSPFGDLINIYENPKNLDAKMGKPSFNLNKARIDLFIKLKSERPIIFMETFEKLFNATTRFIPFSSNREHWDAIFSDQARTLLTQLLPLEDSMLFNEEFILDYYNSPVYGKDNIAILVRTKHSTTVIDEVGHLALLGIVLSFVLVNVVLYACSRDSLTLLLIQAVPICLTQTAHLRLNTQKRRLIFGPVLAFFLFFGSFVNMITVSHLIRSEWCPIAQNLNDLLHQNITILAPKKLIYNIKQIKEIPDDIQMHDCSVERLATKNPNAAIIFLMPQFKTPKQFRLTIGPNNYQAIGIEINETTPMIIYYPRHSPYVRDVRLIQTRNTECGFQQFFSNASIYEGILWPRKDYIYSLQKLSIKDVHINLAINIFVRGSIISVVVFLMEMMCYKMNRYREKQRQRRILEKILAKYRHRI